MIVVSVAPIGTNSLAQLIGSTHASPGSRGALPALSVATGA